LAWLIIQGIPLGLICISMSDSSGTTPSISVRHLRFISKTRTTTAGDLGLATYCLQIIHSAFSSFVWSMETDFEVHGGVEAQFTPHRNSGAPGNGKSGLFLQSNDQRSSSPREDPIRKHRVFVTTFATLFDIGVIGVAREAQNCWIGRKAILRLRTNVPMPWP